MDFDYSECPDTIRDAVRGWFDAFAPIVPPWCETVRVRFQLNMLPSADQEPDTRLTETYVYKQYRTATVTLFGTFFTRSPAYQLETILHELLHISEYRYTELVQQLTGLLDEGPLRSTYLQLVEYEREAVVDDIAFGILRLMKSLEARDESCAE